MRTSNVRQYNKLPLKHLLPILRVAIVGDNIAALKHEACFFRILSGEVNQSALDPAKNRPSQTKMCTARCGFALIVRLHAAM